MKHIIRAAGALCVVLLSSGCRHVPVGDWTPDYNYRAQAKPWDLGKHFKGSLDPQGSDAWAQAVKYTLPAKGSLILTVKPSNAECTLDMDVYSDGKVPIMSTQKQADKKLTTDVLDPGDYIIKVYEDWKKGQETSFDLYTIFKPADPDAGNKFGTQATARDLAFEKQASDAVDYSGSHKTHWWHVTVPGQGGLQIKWENQDTDKNMHAKAFFIDPNGGAPVEIDPTAGWHKDDMAAGDYFVKIEAGDAGDVVHYNLKASFKQGDVCKNGGDTCTFSGAEEFKLPADNKKGEVDNSKGKAFHFYVLHLKDKGKLTIEYASETKGSKIVAGLMKKEDDEPQPLKSKLPFTIDVGDPFDLFIKVAANEEGDTGKYSIKTTFVPVNVTFFDIIEIGCGGGGSSYLTVQGGSNQGVRSGATCTIVNAQSAPLDQCVIDQVYPNLSKVRPMGSCNKIPKQGAKVGIQAP
jgi:hypothetical protein